jgi:hypothetical protein
MVFFAPAEVLLAPSTVFFAPAEVLFAPSMVLFAAPTVLFTPAEREIGGSKQFPAFARQTLPFVGLRQPAPNQHFAPAEQNLPLPDLEITLT